MIDVVTGASGHVGSNLVRTLLEKGRRVRVLVHKDDRGIAGLEVQRVGGDVQEIETLREAFEGADVVYHLAAQISITGDREGRVSAVNVDGARNAARAALERGVRRFVHCCSIHAFDQKPLDETLDETRQRATCKHHNAYDRSKALGEAAVREVVAAGLDAVVVHPTAVIGRNDFRLSRMGDVLVSLYHRKLPSLIDGGFDWVDVRDVVAGIIAAGERGRTNESYILGGQWRSVGELAAVARRISGVRPPRFTSPMWLARVGAPLMEGWAKLAGRQALYTGEALEALRGNRTVSHDKATRELGYTARPLEETIRDAYEWFAERRMVGGLAGADSNVGASS